MVSNQAGLGAHTEFPLRPAALSHERNVVAFFAFSPGRQLEKNVTAKLVATPNAANSRVGVKSYSVLDCEVAVRGDLLSGGGEPFDALGVCQ